jgi:hypothetical protein
METFPQQPQDNKEDSSNNEKKSEVAEKKLLDRFFTWAQISLLVGGTFIGGKGILENYDKNNQYAIHLESQLSLEDRKEIEEIKSNIINIFGENIIKEIEDGDKAAFFERNFSKEKDRKTKVVGFEKAGTSNEIISEFISPEYYPDNWVNQEIDKVQYLSLDEIEKIDSIMDGSIAAAGEGGRNIFFFERDEDDKRKSWLDNLEKEALPLFIKSIFSHESAHANDWSADTDMNLKERFNLLNAVIDRLNSDDRFVSRASLRGFGEYYQHYRDHDGTPTLKMAEEYWAEICWAYFEDPQYLLENYPKDFKVVKEMISKQDPDFDPFSRQSGYFDSNTGELLPHWQEIIKRHEQ